MSHGEQHNLRRTLGLSALIVYGVGDILGAGIYALVGKVAGMAGEFSWLSFTLALVTAGFTAMSYAELSSRYPHSGGASHFVQRAFRREGFALLVGWLVFCSGLMSMATVSHAFKDYFHKLLPALNVAPLGLDILIICAFLLLVSYLSFAGMELSARANLTCTSLEVGGLLIVLFAAARYILSDAPAPQPDPNVEPVTWLAVLRAGSLAFYACIGFEDLVNVADESKRPERDIPIALLVSLLIAGTIYLLVIFACLAVLTPAALGARQAPLVDVVQQAAPFVPIVLFAIIPLFAVSNTALLNAVMASRLLYGMSRERLLPRALSAVHPKRHTPHVAVLTVLVVAVMLALSGTLQYLANTTSVLLLSVFLLVNVGLIVIHATEPRAEGFRAPRFVPFLGALTCLGLVAFVDPQVLLRGGVFLLLGLVIIVIHALRPRPA